jgi:DNA-3-methyladenine glycosylase
VAPDLLNKVLLRILPSGERVSGRIVEVEAYHGAEDPASHAFRGRTARNATMFGEPGHLYVYFTYGMHYCANVVCLPSRPGSASAVLLRALAPIAGIDRMRELRRPAGRDALPDRQLCSGPAKLCEALGIDRALDGTDLVPPGPAEDRGRSHGSTPGERVSPALTVIDDGVLPPSEPARGARIGLGAATGEAASWPWRFAVPGDPNLSRPAGLSRVQGRVPPPGPEQADERGRRVPPPRQAERGQLARTGDAEPGGTGAAGGGGRSAGRATARGQAEPPAAGATRR